MKLNLDKNLLNLKGEPTRDKLCDILADVLALSTVGRPAQMIAWAVNLVNDGEIEIDNNNARFLSELIEKSPNIVNLAKAQLLEEIEKTLTQNDVKEDSRPSADDFERDLMRKIKNLP